MKLNNGQVLILAAIRVYKRVISPWFRPACRFSPTCSEYAFQAVERHGVWRGCWMSLCRLGSCHPLSRGGYDPVI